jgi:hypothetical protein
LQIFGDIEISLVEREGSMIGVYSAKIARIWSDTAR